MRKILLLPACLLLLVNFAKAEEFDPLNDLFEENSLVEDLEDTTATPEITVTEPETPETETALPEIALPSIENATRGVGGKVEDSPTVTSKSPVSSNQNANDYLFAPSFSYAGYLGGTTIEKERALTATGPKEIFLFASGIGLLLAYFYHKKKVAK